MNKPPALLLYVKDWFASPTRRLLCPRARLAYLELLFYCWDMGGKLPADPDALRALAECTADEWKDFGKEILKNFSPCGDGFITNKKISGLWKERKAFVQRQKDAANARWQGRCRGNAVALPPQSSAFASASASANLKPKPTAGAKTAPVPPFPSMKKKKNLTPQQIEYAKVRTLIGGAESIIEKAGGSVEPADLKEQLKCWAAEHGFEYDAAKIARVFTVLDERAKAQADRLN